MRARPEPFGHTPAWRAPCTNVDMPPQAGRPAAGCSRRLPAWAQVSLGWTLCVAALPALAQMATNLRPLSDFGQADILLSAASIVQSGSRQKARIDQVSDVTGTDRLLYPVGVGNIADIEQAGADNEAYVSQTGDLNRLRIVQDGLGNWVDALQLGVDNRLDVLQTGAFNVLNSHQEGVGNRITITQAGGNVADLTEVGNRNEISITQVPGGAPISLNLVGNDQRVTITQ
jgi:hypothetical protein